ncbi:MAG: hypothetical protein HKO68_03540 [Desulfobacterales bacterium]|nr:hypothetical protein [Deltaproteobacteria bacterium]NNL75389.1 hypothetical protein [Desulfobacterales bacterium]
MRRFTKEIKWLPIALAVGLSLFIGSQAKRTFAGEDEGDLLNYSFAVWLGSGVYKVSDADKRLAVLRVPLGYTLRDAKDYSLPLYDRIGFKLLMPAVLAYQNETESNTDFGAGAFVPGLEVQIPVLKYWTLKPFAQFGVGKDTGGGDFNYVYGGGIGSLIRIPWHKFVFSIGNSVVLAEDRNANSKDTYSFSLFNAGLDVRHPTNLTLFNRKLDLSGYFIYNDFNQNKAELLSDDGDTSSIRYIYEAGMTIGVEKPVSIWKVDFNRVGVGYRWGNGGFKGISFNMGFPF